MSKKNLTKRKTKKVNPKTLVIAIVIILIGVGAGFHIFKKQDTLEPAVSISQKTVKPNYNVLTGSWLRTDGSYIIKINYIGDDGRARVDYLNPRPIHVSQAKAFQEKGSIRLFIELQDQGYPGSTYTLRYVAEQDVLVGIYFQAAMRQSFEIIFRRSGS